MKLKLTEIKLYCRSGLRGMPSEIHKITQQAYLLGIPMYAHRVALDDLATTGLEKVKEIVEDNTLIFQKRIKGDEDVCSLLITVNNGKDDETINVCQQNASTFLKILCEQRGDITPEQWNALIELSKSDARRLLLLELLEIV